MRRMAAIWAANSGETRQEFEGGLASGGKNAVTVEHERRAAALSGSKPRPRRPTLTTTTRTRTLHFTEAIARPHTAMMRADPTRGAKCAASSPETPCTKSSGGLRDNRARPREETVRRRTTTIRDTPSSPRRREGRGTLRTLARRARRRRRSRGRPPRAPIGSRVRPSGTRWKSARTNFEAGAMRYDARQCCGGGGRHRRGGDRDGTPRIRHTDASESVQKVFEVEKRVRVKRTFAPLGRPRDAPDDDRTGRGG